MGVDQGTTGTTVLLLDEDWNLAASSHKEHKQYYPQPGWVEHDPKEILAQIKEAAEEVMEKAHVTAEQVECMGIDNQGETVVVWDKVTGEPLYPAIVWQDRRTATWIEELEEELSEKEKELYEFRHEMITTQVRLENAEKEKNALEEKNAQLQEELIRLRAQTDKTEEK